MPPSPASPPETLIVVLAARISEWESKGEVKADYFNPANAFQNIVIISLVADQPSPQCLQFLCGAAACTYISSTLLSVSGLLKTCGYRPRPLQGWIQRTIRPQLPLHSACVVRSYGDGISGMVAAILGQTLTCRAVASIHTTVTHAPAGPPASWKLRLLETLENRARQYAHQHLNALLPVYSSALAAIPQAFHGKTVIVPNAVNFDPSHRKTDYQATEITKLISVGRLTPGKSPRPILEALAALDNCHLTLIGDGPERDTVQSCITHLNLHDKITWQPSVRNSDLVKSLKTYDAFVASTEFAEIPKTVIEAGLAGLPIILNTPPGPMPQEYENAPIIWCAKTPSDFQLEIETFQATPDTWKEIGQNLHQHFMRWFDPIQADSRMAEQLKLLL